SGAAAQPADHFLLTPAPVAATSYLDSDVQCGVTYSYRVRTWNGCQLGPASSPVTAKRAQPGATCTLAPDFAGLKDARPEGPCGKVLLAWSPAASRCTCSTGMKYAVWWSTTAPIDPAVTPPDACVTGTSTSVDLGPGGGLTYFLVRAEDQVPG